MRQELEQPFSEQPLDLVGKEVLIVSKTTRYEHERRLHGYTGKYSFPFLFTCIDLRFEVGNIYMYVNPYSNIDSTIHIRILTHIHILIPIIYIKR